MHRGITTFLAMEIKRKRECVVCGEEFVRHNTIQKTCSYTCNKELGQKPISQRSDKKKASDATYEANKLLLRMKVIKEHGKLVCERCNTENPQLRWETHHLILRSERPRHPEIHNLSNLIHVCEECHQHFHEKKSNRNKWVEERKLEELFGPVYK